MSYSVWQDVQSEFKNITFDNSSPVTSTEVTGFIAQIDEEINSYVGARYTLPIVGQANLLLLKYISILLVTARIKEILAVKTGIEEDKNDIRSNPRTIALEMLKKIKNGSMLLAGEFLNAGAATIDSHTANIGALPQFRKGIDQW